MADFGRIGWPLVLLAGCARSIPGSAPSAASSELTLEVTPSLSGSRAAILRSGDEVVSGDGIQVAIKPTVDAHVYVAYCDRSHQLTIFPRDGCIAATAGMITYAPARDASIILDDQVGHEVLYVIASRRPLDVADPELAAAILRAGPDAGVECGEPFDRMLENGRSAVVGDGAAGQPELRVEQAPSPGAAPLRDPSPALPRHEPRAGAASPRNAWANTPPKRTPSLHRESPRVPPPAELQRGGFIRWGAMGAVSAGGDHSDIVVLRYGFTHVASRSSAR